MSLKPQRKYPMSYSSVPIYWMNIFVDFVGFFLMEDEISLDSQLIQVVNEK